MMDTVMRCTLRLLVVLGAIALPLGAAAQSPGSPSVPAGFTIERIATVPGARELAVAPNGDLFVGTSGHDVVLIADAQAQPAEPHVFVHLDDAPVAGVAIDGERLILGAQFGAWELPYRAGDRTARGTARKLATVRTSGVARGHETTTVAVAKGILYASVGSSCNACEPDLDATRASIQRVESGGLQPEARRVRNAIALATNPATGTLWAGVAGQDELAHGHPYEIFDAVTLHAGVVDYGWPYCYENRRAVGNHDCANVAVPRVVFPAYATPIGATFYPLHPSGAHAFPAEYRGGAFVTLHGSWHQPPVAPRIVFVPMNGDEPRTAVNWNDPNAQWREFAGGFQRNDGSRSARPTGVAVAPDGSLPFADDQTGGIYRVRPGS
jgi:glucose/arabinose dehydrogenase